MMTLEQLQAAGLKVTRLASAPDQPMRIVISLPAALCSQVPDQSPVSASAPDLTLADLPCTVYQDGDRWTIEVWERVPGPDESDFRATFPTLDQALSAAHQFYFGQPTLIGDWNVPLHRHPELLQVPLEHVIAQAVNIAASDFARIREQRKQQMYGSFAPLILTQGTTRWEKALQAQFLQIPHYVRKDILLCLRRDAQEAYIVHLPA
jgi:hypothetical protein